MRRVKWLLRAELGAVLGRPECRPNNDDDGEAPLRAVPKRLLPAADPPRADGGGKAVITPLLLKPSPTRVDRGEAISPTGPALAPEPVFEGWLLCL